MVENKIILENYSNGVIDLIPSALCKIKNVNWNDVLYCEASGSYTILHFSNDLKVKKSFNLTTICMYMPVNLFIRCHRKFTVNINYVKIAKLNKPSEICLTNNIIIPVSTRQSIVLKRMIGKFLLQ